MLLLGTGLVPSCTKKLDGNTSFKEATKGFQKELTKDQRKAAIEQLQTERPAAPANSNHGILATSPLPGGLKHPSRDQANQKDESRQNSFNAMTSASCLVFREAKFSVGERAMFYTPVCEPRNR